MVGTRSFRSRQREKPNELWTLGAQGDAPSIQGKVRVAGVLASIREASLPVWLVSWGDPGQVGVMPKGWGHGVLCGLSPRSVDQSSSHRDFTQPPVRWSEASWDIPSNLTKPPQTAQGGHRGICGQGTENGRQGLSWDCWDLTHGGPDHRISRGGLPDHSLVYDVMTKKPRTVEAALDLIQWHESCRGIQRKRAGVRQVSSEMDGASISRVNGKAYVTEERLHQFGRDLLTGIVKELRVKLAKMGPGRTQRRARQGVSWKETIVLQLSWVGTPCQRVSKSGRGATPELRW